MISIEDIQGAMRIAKPLFPRLREIYRLLPETECRCRRPGQCCAFMPELTTVEALLWIETIRQRPEPQRRRLLQGFAAFYLTHPLGRDGCPFLVAGTCRIYADRAFACRAYGLWSPRMGRRRTGKSRLEKKKQLRAWQRFGLRLPAQPAALEIDYCQEVVCVSPPVVSDDDLLGLLGRIVALDEGLGGMPARFASDFGSDVSFLLTSVAVGYRKAVLGKFAVIKERVRFGTRRRLDRLLGAVDAERLFSCGRSIGSDENPLQIDRSPAPGNPQKRRTAGKPTSQ